MYKQTNSNDTFDDWLINLKEGKINSVNNYRKSEVMGGGGRIKHTKLVFLESRPLQQEAPYSIECQSLRH